MGDLRPAHGPLANLPPPDRLLADTAYDSNSLRRFLLDRGTVGQLKDWRHIHTRYDKLAAKFASAAAIAAIHRGWT